MFTKRARGKNFTDSEEHILLDLLNQHNTVLQNKKSDAVTWQKKKETWERIAEEFADQTGVSRPWTALRDKYDNMKRKSRNGIEPGRRKTYGDTPSFSGSSVSEKVGNLMGITGAARLVNQFDSDANYQLVNEAEEGSEEASSTHNSESPHLVKLFKSTIEDYTDPKIEVPETESPEAFQIWHQKRFRACEPPILPDHRGKSSLEEEKVELVKLQQEYYRDANSRAAEKHKYEIEKQVVELQTMRLKNQLIEMEIEEKREEMAKRKRNS
ncbi:myb/SANT-like DNA-binding domain-containing protein 3 isoform X1 [Drosophila kikkawai]|uniref:Regulatory protein zeste n=1 Tax=Drosophila kikkawai TaxID=30033 RepID=A0A6P4IZX2_DROKI